jgi:hypothetical protein
MKKYRFKADPVVEALQYTPENLRDILTWFGNLLETRRGDDGLYLRTIAGTVRIKSGDWIVRNGIGMCQVYTDEAFKASYEGVSE